MDEELIELKIFVMTQISQNYLSLNTSVNLIRDSSEYINICFLLCQLPIT